MRRSDILPSANPLAKEDHEGLASAKPSLSRTMTTRAFQGYKAGCLAAVCVISTHNRALTTAPILPKLRRSRTTRQRAAEESCTERAASARETHGGLHHAQGQDDATPFPGDNSRRHGDRDAVCARGPCRRQATIGFWDHWVPGANKATKSADRGMGRKGEGRGPIDYITSQGNKKLLTIAAEAQASPGHDILAMPTWQPPSTPATSSRSTTSWPS